MKPRRGNVNEGRQPSGSSPDTAAQERYMPRPVWVNAMLAAAVSLVANFSYFVFMLLSSGQNSGRPMPAPPRNDAFAIMEVVFCFMLTFILLSVFTMRQPGSRTSSYLKRLAVCTVIATAFYFIAPHFNRFTGQIGITLSAHRLFQPVLLLKCSFCLVVAALYGMIYRLLYERQNIRIENEKLRSETIQSRYDMLVGQINPHFFFNSLSSLAMLVREGQREAALSYIDRLSDTFRYILRNGQSGMTALGEELGFLDAYRYLLEVRYGGKLFFEVDVPNEYRTWKLPALSLQPLLENAVKHNAITRSNPLTVSITATDGRLEISNAVCPRINDEPSGTGIGLRNLSSRFVLLCGRDIKVACDSRRFTVTLPLSRPES